MSGLSLVFLKDSKTYCLRTILNYNCYLTICPFSFLFSHYTTNHFLKTIFIDLTSLNQSIQKYHSFVCYIFKMVIQSDPAKNAFFTSISKTDKQIWSYLQIICQNILMQGQNYSESKQFWRPPSNEPPKNYSDIPGIQQKLCDFILNNSQKGNPNDVINKIDEFCMQHWMMNLGPEKGNIVKYAMNQHPIRNIIQIGGYCGYSALVFANQIKGVQGASVLSVEVNPHVIAIAKKIHQHSGLGHIIHYNEGPVSLSGENIKNNGPYDMVFIDHIKSLYLSDLQLLESFGVIKSGSLVVGDNIITPGCPEYLAHMKTNPNYKSVLYHSYVEYSDHPDAVLVSVRK